MLEFLLGLKYQKPALEINYKKIPVNAWYPHEETINKFNEIYLWCKNNIKNKIHRTPSGGISQSRIHFKPPMWDMVRGGSWINITIVLPQGSWRLQLRFEAEATNKKKAFGAQAFNAFKKKLKSNGINLDNYIINNGPEVKEQIERPLIKLDNIAYRDLIWDNVHHVDFHNSYPAGLVNTHPEFGPVVTELYEKRKIKEEYKAMLNYSIGYMQSIHCCNAKWAHLSRDAIKDNNDRIKELAKRLKDSGRRILAYNTDGIWYHGEVYHGAGEGKRLGEWENDHIDCKWRAKSAGCYEYIEDGAYHPVVRGRTVLERSKPRSEWEWGDIYRRDAEPIIFIWNDEVGIIQINEEETESYGNQLWVIV